MGGGGLVYINLGKYLYDFFRFFVYCVCIPNSSRTSVYNSLVRKWVQDDKKLSLHTLNFNFHAVITKIQLSDVLYSFMFTVQSVYYCKLVIIRYVPIFAIFVSALNDEFTY